ncbi:MAG: ComF family protein [Pseudomonadota bacterium]
MGTPPLQTYSANSVWSEGLRTASLHALKRALDLVYPPQCAGCDTQTTAPHGLCPTCWRDTDFITGAICHLCGAPVPLAEPGQVALCEPCLAAPPNWDAGRAAILYRGTGRRIVLSLKHGDRLDLVRTVAGWMQRAAPDLVAEADVIAPIPLHWRRYVQRRYNQAAEIAKALGRASPAEVIPDLLTRPRATPPQEGMDRETRFETQRGALTLARPGAVAGRSILLIDDVMTSGATLAAATEALRGAHPARVAVLVLARVARDE